MIYEKLAFQDRLEKFYDNSPLRQDKRYFVANYRVTDAHKPLLEESLKSDAKSFYYKGLVSLCQGLSDSNKNLHSWATIKLYYSVFYFLRASLCLKNKGFYRNERELYFLHNAKGNGFVKTESSDHRATIKHSKENTSTDSLLSNMIDNKIVYDWYVEQREFINYKNKNFPEPDCLDIWDSIYTKVKNNKFENFILKLFDLSAIDFCFQEDYAIVSIPLQLYFQLNNEFSNSNIIHVLNKEQIVFLRKTLKMKKEVTNRLIHE